MGAMKRFAEKVSEEMGFHGTINAAVITEADRRLHAFENHQYDRGYSFEVYIVHGLYTGEGDGNGRFVFPIDREGYLIEHYDSNTARHQRANYRACRRGKYKGYKVTGPKSVIAQMCDSPKSKPEEPIVRYGDVKGSH